MSLEQLMELVPPPEGRHVEIDWESLESRLGFVLPTDYKRLVEVYGPGTFDRFISVYQPNPAHEWVDLEHQVAQGRWTLEYYVNSGETLPYDANELLLVAGTDNGDYLYWVRRPSDDPDRWFIVGNEARDFVWPQFDGNLVDFLTEVLSGRYHFPIFPDDFAGSTPVFVPYDD